MRGPADPKMRKPVICARNGCNKCGAIVCSTPEDCPFKILHLLDLGNYGICQMPRNTGKTTKLVAMANTLIKSGRKVYVVAMNLSMRKMLYSRYGLCDKVVTVTEHNWETQMRGRVNGYMLFDEIKPIVVDEIMRAMPFNFLVAAYYT